MADSDKPNPIEDIRKGLGLFFRAAKTTIDQFPADKLEDAILQGAKEVGRAVENVARSVEKQVRGDKADKDAVTGVRVDASAEAPKDQAPPAADGAAAPPADAEKKPEDPPKT